MPDTERPAAETVAAAIVDAWHRERPGDLADLTSCIAGVLAAEQEWAWAVRYEEAARAADSSSR